MNENVVNRVADALIAKQNRGLEKSGFGFLVREDRGEAEMDMWRGFARVAISELDLSDADLQPDRVVMSFWRFDGMLRQARKEAWDEGYSGGALFGYSPMSDEIHNPYE